MKQGGRVCLLGFGEVGQILAADLRVRSDEEVSAWDLQFVHEESAQSHAAARARIFVGKSAADAVAGARVVISAVTAAQDVAAALSVQPHLQHGAFFLDLNSVSPGVKQQTAQVVESVGARYVEAAIMAPIAPKRLATAMLFGGPHATEFLPFASDLGLSGVQVFSDEVGRAAAAKMCRSVIVKGMEALITESLLTARKYGVENAVIDSLANLFPGTQWSTFARYMMSRSLVHGQRRAEEMREVVRTVNEAGIDAWMSDASAKRQEWAAQFRPFAAQESLEALLDAVLAAAARARGDQG